MARDSIHYQVRRALEKDGWDIIADPFYLLVDGVKLEIDLEAEKAIVVEKDNERILVEIKSFNKTSILYSFYEAYGQYDFYRDALNDSNINQEIYLAISLAAYNKINQTPFLLKRIIQHNIKIIVVDIVAEIVVKWIK